jgi:hypothetical protein
MLQEEMDAIVEMLDVRVAALKAELIEFFDAQLEEKAALVASKEAQSVQKEASEVQKEEAAPAVKSKTSLPSARTPSRQRPGKKSKASNLNRRHTGDGKMNGV